MKTPSIQPGNRRKLPAPSARSKDKQKANSFPIPFASGKPHFHPYWKKP